VDKRIIDFIAALRAAGVRISVAESADALRAVEQVGIYDRETFQAALATTLIKEASDQPTFDRLFPFYFGSGGPPLLNPAEGLTPEQQAMLQRALQALMGEVGYLARMVLEGRNPSRTELEHMAQRAGLIYATDLRYQSWLTRRLLQEMGWQDLSKLLNELWRQLAQMGLDPQALDQLQRLATANQETLREQVARFVGQSIARQAADTLRPQSAPDLMDRPFRDLSPAEVQELHNQVRRLVARLRSRAALRQKRARKGNLDPKATIRANLRYGGVPLDLRHKWHHLKPKLVLMCDVSTSVRDVVSFLLRLTYELQDQVSKTRSFAFIDHVEEISHPFAEYPPDIAVRMVLEAMPPGSYNTDLGASLRQFASEYMDAVDLHTTLIIVGDGRNNYNDPGLDTLLDIKRRARRILWLNPDPPFLWGKGDSDMLSYLPLCDGAYEVSNLAQLATVVDRILGMG